MHCRTYPWALCAVHIPLAWLLWCHGNVLVSDTLLPEHYEYPHWFNAIAQTFMWAFTRVSNCAIFNPDVKTQRYKSQWVALLTNQQKKCLSTVNCLSCNEYNCCKTITALVLNQALGKHSKGAVIWINSFSAYLILLRYYFFFPVYTQYAMPVITLKGLSHEEYKILLHMHCSCTNIAGSVSL